MVGDSSQSYTATILSAAKVTSLALSQYFSFSIRLSLRLSSHVVVWLVSLRMAGPCSADQDGFAWRGFLAAW